MPILPFKETLPAIDATAFIADSATIIGDVNIGAESSIWFGCVVRGDVNYIRIGARTNIQDNSVIHVDSRKYPTLIGDGATVGHMALLHACTIKDNAFIGMQACVMDGAVVEEFGFVAAGALVTPGKTIPSGEIWAGRPAKFLKKLGDDDLEQIKQSARNYADLAAQYRERERKR